MIVNDISLRDNIIYPFGQNNLPLKKKKKVKEILQMYTLTTDYNGQDVFSDIAYGSLEYYFPDSERNEECFMIDYGA